MVEMPPEPTPTWNVNSLKEYVDKEFANIQRSVDKAEHSSELREQKNNEFRGQLDDQAATFPTRAEVTAKFQALEDKINAKNLQIVLSLSVGFVAVLVAVFNFASANA